MSKFQVVDHVCPAQHMREYPRATATHQGEVLRLAIKQYIPRDNPSPKEGDITILATHANGFQKSCTSPYGTTYMKPSNFEVFAYGAFGWRTLPIKARATGSTKTKVGDDPHFHDHARDLLQIVNTFRDDFVRPVVGIGHSMGCDSLLWLSTMHPRLFSSLVMMDPIGNKEPAPNVYAIFKMATVRNDVLPSMDKAQAMLEKAPVFKTFDSRVKGKMLGAMFRHLPTFLHPDKQTKIGEGSSGGSGSEGPVTFATPHHQEAFSIARPNYDNNESNAASHGFTPSRESLDTHPDVYHSFMNTPFYFPPTLHWCNDAWYRSIRPPVHYVWGSKSPYSLPERRVHKMELTGTGPGGSGGARLGQVQEHVVEGAGHFVCFDRVTETAESIGQWLADGSKVWEERERRSIEGNKNGWLKKSRRERQMVDERWTEHMHKFIETHGEDNIVRPSADTPEAQEFARTTLKSKL